MENFMGDLIEDLLCADEMEEWHDCLKEYGFIADDVNLDYDCSVGICYSCGGDYYAEMMLLPEDDCLFDEEADEEENKAYYNYIEACRRLDWYKLGELTIKRYIYITDAEGEEILGYKDFGISHDEFSDLIGRR